MNSQIYAAIITLLGGILISAMTYWFSKQRELEAEIRKEKLIYYKEFFESLSGVIEGGVISRRTPKICESNKQSEFICTSAGSCCC
ncbi:hypothetical protein [Chromobacterium vaccinii]|uniref:hypothetical protein n=1 Tax=Chromobacterium vaccinii TaxID=1108595 RepID=UPI001E3AD549|nr:hypothetical protein [Chromobacterium vaccinii]MCD4502307.1 hypothetical protein [Chromobacterium vaccinii]